MIGLQGGLPLGPQPSGKLILVPSQFIEPIEVSIEHHGTGTRLRTEITDEGAEDVLRQLSGEPSQFSEHEDLLKRLAEAERHAKACMELVADYEGEIEFLKQELDNAKSLGGVVPGNPSPSAGLTAAGGWLAPTVNVYNATPLSPDALISKALDVRASRLPPSYFDPFTHGDTK
jgi:hypothetical protein